MGKWKAWIADLGDVMGIAPRIKICCIKSPDEARQAVACGASAIGLVAAMPSGPGVIPEERIAEIAETVPPPIGTFLLTSERTPEAILSQHGRCGTTTIQLCDHLPPSIYPDLRKELRGIKLVQVVHVTDSDSIDYAVSAAEQVDALLLDSGNLAENVKELGGTGRTHDWGLSRRIRDRVRVPVFLAGGLTEANVAQAIEAVQPFGVDVCSGVRVDDRLCGRKLDGFMGAITP